MKTKYIIFTDLDGTLLDHNTYSFEAARPALKLIIEQKIPLILASSKTHAEMNDLREKFELPPMPFIVENGAAVFYPCNYFPGIFRINKNGLWCKEKFGVAYRQLVKAIEKIAAKYRHEIRGFQNSTDSEIVEQTGLSARQVVLARQREYSLPLFKDKNVETILLKELPLYSLNLIHGARFMHVVGSGNKGTAINYLMGKFSEKFPNDKLISVAIGDSRNDIPMFEQADIAILVRKPDNTFEKINGLSKLIYSDGIGPAGWNLSLMNILHAGGTHG